MKVMISIEHPAWAHQFRYIIKELQARGDEVLVLAVEKDGDTQLLRDFGIPYTLMEKTTGRNVVEKAWLFGKLCVTYAYQAHTFKPDILIGRASPMMAIAARLCGKPHVLFEDTEISKFSLRICRLFSTLILTPENFLGDLGKKQRRLPIYKELFYLHPDIFTPDKTVLLKHGVAIDKPYVIVRFVSWNASHDIGKRGLSEQEKLAYVKELSQYARVYITSEETLAPELEPYRLTLPYHLIHHALYYAALVISEGATTASEAAVLGTYAFYLNEIDSGTTREQERRFRLIRILHDTATRYKTALTEAIGLLCDSDLWHKGKTKRERMLADMPNPNEIFLNIMEEYIP